MSTRADASASRSSLPETRHDRLRPTTDRIGPLVDAASGEAARSGSRSKGRWITLAPLDAQKHAEALYEGSNGDAAATASGPTCSRRRSRTSASFAADLELKARSVDPLFFAVIDNATGSRGWLSDADADRPGQSRHRGRQHHVYAGDAADRTARPKRNICSRNYVFDALGYRRYEWKCNNLNAPSKRAAERFGFTFEGVFRQHMIVKGRNRDTAWFAMLDGEWPARKAAYERWLSPDNFDADGRQRQRLSELMPKAPAGDHGGDADVLARRRNADR